MFKNVASQKLIVFAFDSTTNLPKTGDAANITAYVSKDYGSVTVLGDTTATEMDATNAKGYYLFDLTQAETNANTLLFSAKSATANIVVIGSPATVFTDPPNHSALAIDSSGNLTGSIATATAVTTVNGLAAGVINDAAFSTTAGPISKLGIVDQGTAQSVSATTLQLRSAAAFADSELIGAVAYIVSATTGAGQARVITAYTGATDTATVDNWTTTPTGTVVYQIFAGAPNSSAGVVSANVTKWNGTTVATPATAGVPDINVKNINNVAATSVTTVNANIGTTQPINFTGTGGSALAKSDMVDVAGAAVSTSSAQIGVNVVNAAGTAWGSGAITAASIASAALTSAKFANDTGLASIRSNTAQAGSGTTITLDASASATNDFYKNALIYIVAGTGAGQGRFITAYVGATKVATVSTWATNPDNTSVFTILPFDAIPGATAPTAAQNAAAVWDEARSSHTTAGSFGEGIASVQGNVTGSVATATAVTTVNGLAANVITAASIASAALNGKGDWNVGKTGYALSSAGISAIWQDTTAGDFTTAGSIGKTIVNGVSLGTGITINGYTGNTPQTGDSYARLGAPAGASVSADVAAVKTDTAAVKVQTDKLTFTVANQLDANVQSINDVTILGDGSGTPFQV